MGLVYHEIGICQRTFCSRFEDEPVVWEIDLQYCSTSPQFEPLILYSTLHLRDGLIDLKVELELVMSRESWRGARFYFRHEIDMGIRGSLA